MKITYQSENRVVAFFPKLGSMTFSKFSPDFDHGAYKNRPWHVCTTGRNFATLEECFKFCQEAVDNWEEPEPAIPSPSSYYHAEQTHSFLCTEAALDSCPY